MSETYDLRIERTFAAPIGDVYNAFIDPELMVQWYAPSDGMAAGDVEVDAREGGAWSIRFGPRDDLRYREFGTFDELSPPDRIVYTCSMTGTDHDEDLVDTTVTIELAEAGEGKTLMVLTHSGYGSAKARDAHQGGWPGFLDRLEAVITA